MTSHSVYMIQLERDLRPLSHTLYGRELPRNIRKKIEVVINLFIVQLIYNGVDIDLDELEYRVLGLLPRDFAIRSIQYAVSPSFPSFMSRAQVLALCQENYLNIPTFEFIDYLVRLSEGFILEIMERFQRNEMEQLEMPRFIVTI